MSISEVVSGIAGLYCNHLNDRLTYDLFVDRVRHIANPSSLDTQVNLVYKELSELGTRPLLAPYIKDRTPRKDAISHVQNILQYTEFFIKYEMLLPRIRTPEVRARFESFLTQSSSIDEAIVRYNQEIGQLGIANIRPYMVSPKQPYESIVARSKDGFPDKNNRHRNKYALPRLTKFAALL